MDPGDMLLGETDGVDEKPFEVPVSWVVEKWCDDAIGLEPWQRDVLLAFFGESDTPGR